MTPETAKQKRKTRTGLSFLPSLSKSFLFCFILSAQLGAGGDAVVDQHQVNFSSLSLFFTASQFLIFTARKSDFRNVSKSTSCST